MAECIMVCKNVSKRFGRQIVIHDLSFAIHAGEIYGLAGPNGAGKSTLISLICGLVLPTYGDIEIFGLRPSQSLSNIGSCFQTPSLYPYLSVERNIRLLSNNPDRALKYLEELGLNISILKRKTGTLSYGQQKRVGLAISLSKPAKLYLLDEPTNGLDLSSAEKLCALLRNMAAEGTAVMLASHEWEVIGDICHRTGILLKGILQRELTTADYSSSPGLSEIRLVTNPKITEDTLKSFFFLQNCRSVGEGEWELGFASESDAQAFLRVLSIKEIPVIQWRQKTSTTEHWRQIYQEMLNGEGS